MRFLLAAAVLLASCRVHPAGDCPRASRRDVEQAIDRIARVEQDVCCDEEQ